VYLQSGQIDEAEAHFAVVAADVSVPEPTKALNAAFVASARGDWDAAGEVWRGLVEEDDANHTVRFHHPFMLGWLAHVAHEGACLLLLYGFVRPLIIWPSLFLAKGN
jgi:hypothetical protein